jgi:sirohydrochlorin cobaltochelatase
VNQDGVLIIAHGSKSEDWVRSVDQIVSQAHIAFPHTIGYLELVEGRSIADGVRYLEKVGVKRINVVPLFVCSGSTHLEEIQYMLGLKPESAIDTEFIHPQAEVIWCSAMDDHPNILRILSDRIQALSHSPSEETLLLVAHGSDEPVFDAVWEQVLRSLTSQLKSAFPFRHVTYGTLYPDTIRECAAQLSSEGDLLVIPVFLSEGYLTSKVVTSKLEGLEYKYSGEAYLPHPLISRWIESVISHLIDPQC